MESNADDGFEFFRKLQVSSIVRSDSKYNELISIYTDTPLEECLRILKEKGVVSLPMKDEGENFVGIIDVYQVTCYLAFAGFEPDHTPTKEEIAQVADLTTPTAEALTDTSVCVLDGDASFQSALEWLARGTHRLILQVDSKASLVTQTDLMRFLDMHIDKFGDFKDKPLRLCSLFIKKTHTICSSANVLSAIRALDVKNISCVGVVDKESGLFVSAFNRYDLRGFTNEKLDMLFMTVEEYVKQNGIQVITCSEDITVREVLRIIARDHLHNVWILDKNKKLVGISTLTDIANYFFSNTFDIQ